MTTNNVPSPASLPTASVIGRGLTKAYGRGETKIYALAEVDIEIPRGQFTVIAGPSGSGKSTLLHCLAGLDQPDAGKVEICGQDIFAMKDRELTLFRRHHIGFIFQAFNLLPALDARANLELPLRLAKKQADPQWEQQVIDTLGITERLHHRPHELSGGQQQRLAIGRALLSRPEVIFADEPTGNLDSVSGAEVLGLLRQAVSELGQTVVVVTHDPKIANTADRCFEVRDGRLS